MTPKVLATVAALLWLFGIVTCIASGGTEKPTKSMYLGAALILIGAALFGLAGDLSDPARVLWRTK